VSDIDALTREQMIAALTLFGWEPQLVVIVNHSLRVALTLRGNVWHKDSLRPTVPKVDGWHNFSDEHLKRFLRRIEAEPL
jgi:hypothetical protein